jgi:hypothetical protein
MLEWPPPDAALKRFKPASGRAQFATLRALFHHAYAGLPGWVWRLPAPQQSDEVLRHVARVARSYTQAGLQRLSDDSSVHPGEYAVICALANLGDEIENFLRELNAAGDDFPAARLDPEGRRGRRLS